MPYPYPIRQSGDTDDLIPCSSFATNYLFEYGGNLYCVVYTDSGGYDSCRVMKSTDDGVTWNIKSQANEQYNSARAYLSCESYCCQVDGDDLLVSYPTDKEDLGPAVSLRTVVRRFNLATDTWDSPSTFLVDNGLAPEGYPGTTERATWQVVRLSDGRYFHVCSRRYTVGASTFLRAEYQVYSSGSWSAASVFHEENDGVSLASLVYPAGAYLLPNDYVLVVTYSEYLTWIMNGVWVRSWAPSDSLGTQQLLGMHPQDTNEVGHGQIFSAGGVDYIGIPFTFANAPTFGGSRGILGIAQIDMTGGAVNAMRLDTLPNTWPADPAWYEVPFSPRAPVGAFIHTASAEYVCYAEQVSLVGPDHRASLVCNKGRAWAGPTTIYDMAGRCGSVNAVLRANGNIGIAYFGDAAAEPQYYEFTPTCAASPCGAGAVEANKYYIV